MALNASLTFREPLPRVPDARFNHVWEVRFSDAISEPFEIHVLASWNFQEAEPLYDLLGREVTLSLPEEPLLPAIHGILRRIVRTATNLGEPSSEIIPFELTIAPREWVLTQSSGCRIFQNKTVPEIVEEVLAGHGLPAPARRLLQAAPAREYCVQYDETDHDFVHRLLAEEGIASFFHQGTESEWTLTGDTTTLAPAEDQPVIDENPLNLTPGGLAVLRRHCDSSLATARAIHRDHDFERPLFVLEGAWEGSPTTQHMGERSLEDYRYEPGRLRTVAHAETPAIHAVEAARGLAHTHRVEVNFMVSAGSMIRLLEDDAADISTLWLVVRCEAVLLATPDLPGKAGVNDRKFRLVLVRATTPFRPCAKKKPLIFGTQSARVVGDTAEGTVDVDPYGRVKVELRWDRRDLWSTGAPGKSNPTRRVRVAQAWAGPGYGFVLLPRIGDEVIVAYEEGNPDLPIVIGRVHNAVSVTPLHLPDADKTLSIWRSQSFGPNGPEEGFNAIMMDDAAGAEVLGMKAQRDLVSVVGRNASSFVGADLSTNVGGSQTLVVAGDQTIRVGGKHASQAAGGSTPAAGGRDVGIAGMYSVAAKGIWLDSSDFMTIHSVGNLAVTCDADRTDNSKNHYILADGIVYASGEGVTLTAKKILLQAGGSSIELTDGGVVVTSSGPVEINGNPVHLNC